jgi:hypothetical protein
MGQIQSIQSNLSLSQTLSDLAINQKLSAAGNRIGKQIYGLNTDGKKTTGNVTSVARVDNSIYLKLDTGDFVSIDSVTGIVNTTASTSTGSTTGTTTTGTTTNTTNTANTTK